MVDALEEKKGENIVLLDLQEISSFTDYFILCNGSSERMLHALTDVVDNTARVDFKLKGRIEGIPESGWVIVDLGDIIVHLLSEEMRNFYKIEELWSGGKTLLRLQ